MRSRGLVEATAVVLAALALTCLLTYPLAFKMGSVGRLNTDDGRLSIWNVAWVAHTLTTTPAGVYQANIFYPHRNALAFSEANLLSGVAGIPTWLATGNPYATHNTAVLLAFITAIAGAYYLVRHLTGSREAAAVAGVLYGFCPYIFARTAHIQLLWIGGLPVALLMFHRVVAAPSVSRAVWLGLALWLQAMACAYYGIFAALLVGLATIVFATRDGRWRQAPYWIAIGLAAFISMGLTLPFFLPYVQMQRDAGFARTIEDAQMFSADLGAYLASASYAHRWWLPAIEPFNEVLFPGVLLLGLGLFGVWTAVRGAAPRGVTIFYVLAAAIAFWASFGPDLGLYTVLFNTLPVFSFLRAPARMGLIVSLALTVFAGYALAALFRTQPRARVIAAGLCVAGCLELTQAPLTTLRDAEPVAQAYRVLAQLPAAPVAEFPFFYERSDFPRHAYYMLNSTAHWMPLINGYSDHIPQDFRDMVTPLSSFPTRQSFAILGRLGARYVVFHLNMYDRRSRERLFERLRTYGEYLRPLVQEGDVWLFEIVGWPN